MNYFADFKFFQDSFQLPKTVGEKYLKLATPTQLRVLLYVLSHLAEDPSDEQISSFLSVPEDDIADALKFWETTGILVSKTAPVNKPEDNIKPQKTIRPSVIKPTREEVIRRGNENSSLALLMQEAEKKFNRPLKFSEVSTLVWLFDDNGMDVSLILMLLEYAKEENKLNISFIERTATQWISSGIESISDAEKYISDMYEKRTAWKIVESAFGIEPRMPSSKELDYSKLWIKDWKFTREMLRAAYEKCVDVKSRFNMSYTAKILENWHSKGYTSINQIEESEKNNNIKPTSSMAAYDMNELEKLINN